MLLIAFVPPSKWSSNNILLTSRFWFLQGLVAVFYVREQLFLHLRDSVCARVVLEKALRAINEMYLLIDLFIFSSSLPFLFYSIPFHFNRSSWTPCTATSPGSTWFTWTPARTARSTQRKITKPLFLRKPASQRSRPTRTTGWAAFMVLCEAPAVWAQGARRHPAHRAHHHSSGVN